MLKVLVLILIFKVSRTIYTIIVIVSISLYKFYYPKVFFYTNPFLVPRNFISKSIAFTDIFKIIIL